MPSYNRVMIDGTLADGAEAWCTSCAFEGDSPDFIADPGDLNLWAAAIVAALPTAMGSNMKQGLGTVGRVTKVRVYAYPTIEGPAVSSGEATASVPGTGTALHPLPTSWVFSLRTGLSGRRYRGRMYWPALGETVGTNGRFSSGENALIAAEAEAFLNALASAAPGTGEFRPVVVSKVGGFLTPVSTIAVGDVPDTQRNRRDALVESYATVPYTP